jgi:hypothetical protein
MAQKMELFKLSIEQSIENKEQERNKNKIRVANKKQKKEDNINIDKLKNNPLNALIYKNKDLFDKAFNITTHTLKAGLNIIQGAGNLLKSAIKRKQEKAEQEEELNLPKLKTTQESQADIIIQEKEEWKQKIDEMHAVLVNERKDKSITVLSKGLTGLNKTMQGITEGIQLVAGKEKLILSAVTMGAMGILALVGWFKSGKLQDMIKSSFNANNINLNKDGVKKSQNKIDTLVKDVSNGALNAKSEVDNTVLKLDTQNKTTLGQIQAPTQKQLASGGLASYTDNLVKEGIVDKQAGNLLFKKFNYRNTNTDYNRRKYNNDKGGSKLSFPIIVKIKEITISGEQEHGMSVLFENKPSRNGKKADLLITNMTKIFVPKGKWIPANTVIGIMGENGQIFGDIDAFMEGLTFEEHTNKNTMDSEIIDNNLISYRENDEVAKDMSKTWNKLNEKYSKEATMEQFKNNPTEFISKPAQKKNNNQEKPIVTSTSVNPERASQQQEQLTASQEVKDIKEVPTQPQTAQQTAPTIITPLPTTPVRFADRNLNANEYLNMCDSYIDTNGVC